MRSPRLLASAVVVAASLTGCHMCQNCCDTTGPVPCSPNYNSFYSLPRSGSVASAIGGVGGYPVGGATAVGVPTQPYANGQPYVNGQPYAAPLVDVPSYSTSPGPVVGEGVPIVPPGAAPLQSPPAPQQWVPRGSMSR